MSGPRFLFVVDDNQLAIELSHFGAEVVTLNGEIVHSTRRFRLSGTIPVEIDGKKLEIRNKVSNPFTGNITCSLYRSGNLIHSLHTKAMLSDKNKYLSILLLILSCGAVGYITPMLGDWIWTAPFLFLIAVTASMSCRERIYEVHSQ